MADDVMHEVDQLLKDREKYEAWLNRLESEKRGASGPAYEKVRGDYQQRLEEVLEKLKAHSESIQGKLKGLENKVAEVDSQRSGRSEKLDEAQLRRSVGEFEDEKEWTKLESKLVGSLKESEKELETVRAEIGRLEEIVAQVKGAEARPAAKPEPAPEPEPEPEPVAVEPEPVTVASEPEPVAPEPAAARSGDGLGDDEGLISLEELVLEDEDMKEVSVKAEPTAAEPSSIEKAESAEGGVGDELAFLESLSLGGNEEPESFTFLEQRGSGTPQTIICPHCSAANDPAEWYCTECGEELPAE
jgi:hypothetical protein